MNRKPGNISENSDKILLLSQLKNVKTVSILCNWKKNEFIENGSYILFDLEEIIKKF